MDNNMKKEIATILKDMKKDVKHYECNEKINTKVKKGTEVIVIMVEGENKYKDYIILDKETKKVLSDYRTRFDIIDC